MSTRTAYFAIGGAVIVIAAVVGGLTIARRPTPVVVLPATKPVGSAPVNVAVVDVEIDSITPHASVILRGRQYALPYAAEVTAADVPEDVTVSAPEHQARTFVFAFDRPRRLGVTLAAGSGVIVASPQETQAALSEPEAELSVHSTADAGTPKVGLIVKPAPTDTIRKPIPSAATTTVATASVAPPATTPLAVVTTPPPVTAVTTTTPTTPTAAEVKPGTIEPRAVRATVKTHFADVQQCYDRAHMEIPELRGRVVVDATINPSGQVVSASVGSSTVKSARLESCLVSAFKTWAFPAPSGGVNGNISYSFVFQP